MERFLVRSSSVFIEYVTVLDKREDHPDLEFFISDESLWDIEILGCTDKIFDTKKEALSFIVERERKSFQRLEAEYMKQ